MTACHEHNLRAPWTEHRPFGIRVRLRRGDPFRNLLGDDWQREHWFPTRAERDRALADMSGRYVYFRPGDEPALDFERVDAEAG